jgi:hypothetical protein
MLSVLHAECVLTGTSKLTGEGTGTGVGTGRATGIGMGTGTGVCSAHTQAHRYTGNMEHVWSGPSICKGGRDGAE